MSKEQFADDWITKGWSRGPEGKWIELGQSARITVEEELAPPQLGIHDVAEFLNNLEVSSKPMDRAEADAVIVKIDKALQMVYDLCNQRREWMMSIPTRPDYDPDLVIGDALSDARKLLMSHPVQETRKALKPKETDTVRCEGVYCRFEPFDVVDPRFREFIIERVNGDTTVDRWTCAESETPAILDVLAAGCSPSKDKERLRIYEDALRAIANMSTERVNQHEGYMAMHPISIREARQVARDAIDAAIAAEKKSK